MNKINKSGQSSLKNKIPLPKNSWSKLIISVLLVFSSIYFLYSFLDYHEFENVVNTRYKEIREVVLPDGTKVTLRGSSTIMYPKQFGSTRTVYFNGEAFFEVSNDPEKPFVIESDQTMTETKGTSFNLRSGFNEAEVEIIVVSGNVNFSYIDDDNETILLNPGEKGVFEREELSVAKSTNNNMNFLSWKTKKLTFNNIKLVKAIKDLENYFHINFVVKNKEMLNCEFNAEFLKPTIDDVVNLISISLKATCIIKSDKVVFKGDGCK